MQSGAQGSSLRLPEQAKERRCARANSAVDACKLERCSVGSCGRELDASDASRGDAHETAQIDDNALRDRRRLAAGDANSLSFAWAGLRMYTKFDSSISPVLEQACAPRPSRPRRRVFGQRARRGRERRAVLRVEAERHRQSMTVGDRRRHRAGMVRRRSGPRQRRHRCGLKVG